MSARDLLNLEEEEQFSDAYNSDEEISRNRKKPKLEREDSEEDEDEGSDDDSDSLKPLTQAQLEATQKAIKRSGVVYLSSIPPYMKPQKMKQILERFGPVGRIFLKPEDAKVHKLRTRAGGNRKTKFTEGWAEFERKSHAKVAADTLNCNKIGGRKGSFYYDDILNIKYLKNFKWRDLTEGMALEAQERRERMTAEIAQATKEYKIFAENVERKAMFDTIKEKKGKVKNPVHREFRQNETRDKRAPASSQGGSGGSDLKDVLSQVF